MSAPSLEGGCTCGEVRYRLASEPMVVHCCHCRNCQCQTGSAFVVNLLIEADRIEVTAGAPAVMSTRSASIRTLITNALPVCRWQLRQWQQWTKSGSDVSR